MTIPVDELMHEVRRDLAAWHATHPRATFAELETVVEERVRELRAALLQEQTAAVWREEQPACARCGTTMVPRSRSTRMVVLPGEEVVPVERHYVVCPACGTGLFPPR
jgi:YgiT-type zinc finger domain-containing protein